MSDTAGTWAWIDDAGIYHSLDRSNLRVRQLTGFKSLPPLRGQNVQLATRPGEYFLEKQHDARPLALELLIFQPEVPSSIYTVLDELVQMFAVHGQGTLINYRPDGTMVTAQAQVTAWAPTPQDAIGSWYNAFVQFRLADPYFYGKTITLGPTSISGGTGNQVLIHPGTVRGWKVVFTFAGPVTSPSVTNAANGYTLAALTTAASGHTIVIDSGAWTAYRDTTSVIGSVTHSGANEFMMIEPGTNNLSFTGGTGTGATVTTTFIPPYL